MWKNIKKINRDICKLGLLSKREELSRGIQNSSNENKLRQYLQSLLLQGVFNEFLSSEAYILNLQGGCV